jgi:hypothetical protein
VRAAVAGAWLEPDDTDTVYKTTRALAQSQQVGGPLRHGLWVRTGLCATRACANLHVSISQTLPASVPNINKWNSSW